VDKIAVATGAAKGIGRAIALRLARDGVDVAVVDMDLEGARQTASEIEAMGHSALPIRTDATKSSDVNEMVQTTLKEFGRIDILVNNAGGREGKERSALSSIERRGLESCRCAESQRGLQLLRNLGV